MRFKGFAATVGTGARRTTSKNTKRAEIVAARTAGSFADEKSDLLLSAGTVKTARDHPESGAGEKAGTKAVSDGRAKNHTEQSCTDQENAVRMRILQFRCDPPKNPSQGPPASTAVFLQEAGYA